MSTETRTSSKIALVTGGSRGLGRNTVLSLAKRGIQSIFTYNANSAEAEKVVALAGELGVKTVALQLDTSNSTTFDDFVVRLREKGSDSIN